MTTISPDLLAAAGAAIVMALGVVPAIIASEKGLAFVPWWLYGAVLFPIALPHAIFAREPTIDFDPSEYGPGTHGTSGGTLTAAKAPRAGSPDLGTSRPGVRHAPTNNSSMRPATSFSDHPARPPRDADFEWPAPLDSVPIFAEYRSRWLPEWEQDDGRPRFHRGWIAGPAAVIAIAALAIFGIKSNVWNSVSEKSAVIKDKAVADVASFSNETASLLSTMARNEPGAKNEPGQETRLANNAPQNVADLRPAAGPTAAPARALAPQNVAPPPAQAPSAQQPTDQVAPPTLVAPLESSKQNPIIAEAAPRVLQPAPRQPVAQVTPASPAVALQPSIQKPAIQKPDVAKVAPLQSPQQGLRQANVSNSDSTNAKYDSPNAKKENRVPGPLAAPVTATRDEVRQVQTSLQAFGYDPGPAEGIVTHRTQAAIRSYQRSHGLAATGAVDRRLIDSIRAEISGKKG